MTNSNNGVIGTSKIYENYRISIHTIKDVLGVNEGDYIHFYRNPKGKICIEKIVPVVCNEKGGA